MASRQDTTILSLIGVLETFCGAYRDFAVLSDVLSQCFVIFLLIIGCLELFSKCDKKLKSIVLEEETQ